MHSRTILHIVVGNGNYSYTLGHVILIEMSPRGVKYTKMLPIKFYQMNVCGCMCVFPDSALWRPQF